MKLNEAIQNAANCQRGERGLAIRQVADFMRFSLGWNYEQSAVAAEKSGIARDRWEELLMEADYAE